jgi:Flp pilus assembly protein TadG
MDQSRLEKTTNLKQMYHDENGATAIEFAFFTIPFLFLIIGLIELGLMFTAGTLLQGATDNSARLIRTGQAQNSGDPQGTFEAELCDSVSIFLDCDDLVYEVIKIDDSDGFGGASTNVTLVQPAIDDEGNLESDGFDPGAENSLVLIRVAYRYPLITPFIAPFLSDNTDGKRLLMSTAIVQNEPYRF